MFASGAVTVGHTYCASAVKEDAAGLSMSDDGQVRPLAGWVEKGHGGRATPSVARGQLEIADPFLLGPIVIWVERIASLLGCRHPCVTYGPLQAHIGHPKRALIAVIVISTALLTF